MQILQFAAAVEFKNERMRDSQICLVIMVISELFLGISDGPVYGVLLINDSILPYTLIYNNSTERNWREIG